MEAQIQSTHLNHGRRLPSKHFNILTLNIHSLIHKLHDLQYFIQNFHGELHAFVITETWLKPRHGVDKQFFYNIPGYDCINTT